MQIPTNPLALLFAEIDSVGSLRLAGDRVLFGHRPDTEWLMRQKVAQCRQTIADIVHGYGGVVVRAAGDTMLCNLVDANAAIAAACAIQQAITPKTPAADGRSSAVSIQMGVKVAMHYDKVFVESGNLSGHALDIIDALIVKVESEHILLTDQFSQHLSDKWPPFLNLLQPAELISGDDKIILHEVNWSAVLDVDPLAKPTLSQTDLDTDERSNIEAQRVTPAAVIDSVQAPGLMQKLPAQTETEQPTELAAALPEQATAEIKPGPSPEMELRYKGRQILLSTAHPSITLRGGADRTPHARISLRGENFILESLLDGGTQVRQSDGAEATCTTATRITGVGQISLSGGFGANAQVVEYKVNA